MFEIHLTFARDKEKQGYGNRKKTTPNANGNYVCLIYIKYITVGSFSILPPPNTDTKMEKVGWFSSILSKLGMAIFANEKRRKWKQNRMWEKSENTIRFSIIPSSIKHSLVSLQGWVYRPSFFRRLANEKCMQEWYRCQTSYKRTVEYYFKYTFKHTRISTLQIYSVWASTQHTIEFAFYFHVRIPLCVRHHFKWHNLSVHSTAKLNSELHRPRLIKRILLPQLDWAIFSTHFPY